MAPKRMLINNRSETEETSCRKRAKKGAEETSLAIASPCRNCLADSDDQSALMPVKERGGRSLKAVQPSFGVEQATQEPPPLPSPKLAGVIAKLAGVTPAQQESIQSRVLAFGGKVLPEGSADSPTHIITGTGVSPVEVPKEYPGKIVWHSWLDEVLEGKVHPMDDTLARNYKPLNLRYVEAAVADQHMLDSAGNAVASRGMAPTSGSSQEQLRLSLSETLASLHGERPDEVEASSMRKAMKLSLAEALQKAAVEIHRGAPEACDVTSKVAEPSSWEVLGLPPNAEPAAVRSAYRKLALAAHPDKGGDAEKFSRLCRAYFLLSGNGSAAATGGERELLALNLPGSGDLKRHRDRVREWFQKHGVDLTACMCRFGAAIGTLGLEVKDLGQYNENEQGEVIFNQCFYLVLAHQMTDGDALCDTALSLKRVIEQAVLAKHPDWADTRVGENVQAFGDFLVCVLGTSPILSEMAVAIFDATSGGVEVYKGRCFPGSHQEAEQRPNMLTMLYKNDHYTSLVPTISSHRPSFLELKHALDEHDVQYVVTDV